jgi:hypothetical protein
MSETKHTPGPWVYNLYPYGDEEVEKRRSLGIEPVRMLTNEGQAPIMGGPEDDSRRIALVDCQVEYKRGKAHLTECAEREANARLIAAAPDLLAVCARFEAYMLRKGDPWDGDDWQLMQDVRAAIAKAHGEQQDCA